MPTQISPKLSVGWALYQFGPFSVTIKLDWNPARILLLLLLMTVQSRHEKYAFVSSSETETKMKHKSIMQGHGAPLPIEGAQEHLNCTVSSFEPSRNNTYIDI